MVEFIEIHQQISFKRIFLYGEFDYSKRNIKRGNYGSIKFKMHISTF
jgi:hypothetical protein